MTIISKLKKTYLKTCWGFGEMENTYEITVRLEWQNIVDANSLREATEIIKEQFKQDHNLDLYDKEIVNVTLVEK